MKKIILPLMLFPVIALSESNDQKQILDDFDYLNTKLICMSEQLFLSTLKEFDEKPMLSMMSNRITDTDGNREERVFPVILFVNSSTGTWTMAEKQSGDKVCVVSIGQQIKPFRQ